MKAISEYKTLPMSKEIGFFTKAVPIFGWLRFILTHFDVGLACVKKSTSTNDMFSLGAVPLQMKEGSVL